MSEVQPFNPHRPFSEVFGDSPARFFQNNVYYNGNRDPIDWSDAAKKEGLEAGKDTQFTSTQAAERVANQAAAKKEALDPITPQQTEHVVVGKLNDDAAPPMSPQEAAEVALAHMNEQRQAQGIPSLDSLIAAGEKAESDNETFQAAKTLESEQFEKSVKTLYELQGNRLVGIIAEMKDKLDSAGVPYAQEAPFKGPGSKRKNAEWIATYSTPE